MSCCPFEIFAGCSHILEDVFVNCLTDYTDWVSCKQVSLKWRLFLQDIEAANAPAMEERIWRYNWYHGDLCEPSVIKSKGHVTRVELAAAGRWVFLRQNFEDDGDVIEIAFDAASGSPAQTQPKSGTFWEVVSSNEAVIVLKVFRRMRYHDENCPMEIRSAEDLRILATMDYNRLMFCFPGSITAVLRVETPSRLDSAWCSLFDFKDSSADQPVSKFQLHEKTAYPGLRSDWNLYVHQGERIFVTWNSGRTPYDKNKSIEVWSADTGSMLCKVGENEFPGNIPLVLSSVICLTT